MADHEGHSLKKLMSYCINCFVTMEIQKCPGLIALNNSLMWYVQMYYIKWIWRVFCLRKVCFLILTQKHFKNNAWKKMRLYMLGNLLVIFERGLRFNWGPFFDSWVCFSWFSGKGWLLPSCCRFSQHFCHVCPQGISDNKQHQVGPLNLAPCPCLSA